MSEVKSEVLFNRALLCLVLGHVASNQLISVGFMVAAAVNFILSFCEGS